LASSQDFTFDGQTFNFKRLAPHGVTFAGTISNQLLPGIPGFSSVLPFAADAVAVGGRLSTLGPSAR
jgi:hypothetical protein